LLQREAGAVSTQHNSDPERRRRKPTLQPAANRLPEHIRILDYRQVETDAQRLAHAIHLRFGERSRNFAYVAVPRGGLIVLGMLSYWLNLSPNRINCDDEASTLVVVDDCCYSGLRIRQTLDRYREWRRIVIAVLYATEEVFSEIANREDRVEDCVSAHKLKDLMPLYETDEARLRDWRVRSLARLGKNRYWVGLPELVVFPWTEPDTPAWNRQEQRLESGWKFRQLGGSCSTAALL